MTFSPGWYPSPSSPGRDQWWNGHDWTPRTRPTDPSGSAPAESPPAATPGWGIGAATLPTAIVGVLLGGLSLAINPVFLPSAIGILLGAAALVSERRIEHRGVRLVLLVVSAVGLAAAAGGVVLELQRLFA